MQANDARQARLCAIEHGTESELPLQRPKAGPGFTADAFQHRSVRCSTDVGAVQT